MSRYSECFVENLGLENHINTHFFRCKTPSNLEGMYRYIQVCENAVLNVHEIIFNDSLFALIMKQSLGV